MYAKELTVVLCIMVLLAFVTPALGQEKADTKTKKVTVKGVAGGEDAGARDNALMDAYRKAIEQGVGTFIQSQTEVENYAVIYDKIISNTEGYIDEYDVVKEGIDNPGTKKAMTWVIIEAVVKLGELKDDWKTLAFLVKKKGNPKIMVVVRDKIDGKAIKGGTDRSSVIFEKFLLEKNIRPVDKATMEENKLNDIKAASLEGNLAKVAALGKEYRADLVIIGYADATFSERSEPYKGAGVWYFYSGSMVYKVVRTDDAQIIHSNQVSSERKTRGSDKSKMEAANKALVNTAKVAASQVLTGIMKAWNKDITIGSEITLTIQGVTFGKIRKIQKTLEKIRFVSEVTRVSFSSGVVKFRVKSRYDTFKLADMLIEKDVCKDYQVTGATKNTIDVDLKQEEE